MLRTVLMAAIVVLGSMAIAQDQPKVIRHTPLKPTSAASGEAMFVSYCAACHGRDGKGDGPAAEALKARPADLTALARNNGGKYPADHVASILRGQATVVVHGTQEMPVWGPQFWQMSHGHENEFQQRIANLTKYVGSLQAK